MFAKSLHVIKYFLIHLSSSILFCRKCVKRFLFLSVATLRMINIVILKFRSPYILVPTIPALGVVSVTTKDAVVKEQGTEHMEN